MKYVDIIAALLLVFGGLNWGLVGFFHVDLVAVALGHASMGSRAVYVLIGLCALYQAMGLSGIQTRWHVE